MDTPAGIPEGRDLQPPFPAPPSVVSAEGGVDQTKPLASLLRRAGAIGIDAAAWLLVAIPIAAIHPSLSPGPGFHRATVGFDINGHGLVLSGVPLLVTTLAWLAYMAVMEATAGASIGKLLTRIRVVTYEGTRPAWGRALARTAMRIIDVLPVFYLLGGTVAAVSDKRQRLGDLVAGTLVVGPSARVPDTRGVGQDDALPVLVPSRPAIRAMTVGLVVILLGLGTYVWATRPVPGAFDRYGLHFDYPVSWRSVDVVFSQAGNPPVFHEQFGIDQYDYLAVSAYQLGGTVTATNLPQVLPNFNWLVQGLATQTQASSLTGPEATAIAGRPAITFSISFALPSGVRETLDATIVFADRTEYMLGCQYRPELASDIQSGCERAIETLHVR